MNLLHSESGEGTLAAIIRRGLERSAQLEEKHNRQREARLKGQKEYNARKQAEKKEKSKPLPYGYKNVILVGKPGVGKGPPISYGYKLPSDIKSNITRKEQQRILSCSKVTASNSPSI
jgi:hypothetical protein